LRLSEVPKKLDGIIAIGKDIPRRDEDNVSAHAFISYRSVFCWYRTEFSFDSLPKEIFHNTL